MDKSLNENLRDSHLIGNQVGLDSLADVDDAGQGTQGRLVEDLLVGGIRRLLDIHVGGGTD